MFSLVTDSRGARERLDYVDWLRVIAVGLLLPFHTARVFDIFEANYVKNDTVSVGLTYIVSFLNLWQMPLLFVLAGMATSLALGWRSSSQYLGERVRRLVVPFVFGLLVIVPPQSYLALVTHTGYRGSYFDFYPSFFDIRLSDLSGYFGGFTPGHLWFILYLAVFSVVALPLLLWLRGARGERLLASAASLVERPGGILVFIVPLALSGLLPDLGGKNPFTDILLFVFGYLLIVQPRLLRSADRARWWALGAAVVLSVAYCAVNVGGYAAGLRVPRFSPVDVTLFLVRTAAGWLWIVALIGAGRRYLVSHGAFIRYAREASYPVYILHQTVIIVLAYFVVGWDAGVMVKFVAVMAGASAGTLLIYEALVRPLDPVRFLFGMKPRARAAGREKRRVSPGAA